MSRRTDRIALVKGISNLTWQWQQQAMTRRCCRLQQERVIRKQQAREKLRRLAAPLLLHHDPSTLALRAFGPIRPKLSVSFERMHVRLRNGTTILQASLKLSSHFMTPEEASDWSYAAPLSQRSCSQKLVVLQCALCWYLGNTRESYRVVYGRWSTLSPCSPC